jgi:hypothetical protein
LENKVPKVQKDLMELEVTKEMSVPKVLKVIKGHKVQ